MHASLITIDVSDGRLTIFTSHFKDLDNAVHLHGSPAKREWLVADTG